VPIISGVQHKILKYLDEHADADVATLGSTLTAGSEGIPTTLDELQAKSIPWAALPYMWGQKVFAVTMKVSVG
jgi:hypothetical protein